MANVNIKFNNKDYILSCEDDQEENLKELANHLDLKYGKLKEKLGNIGERILSSINFFTWLKSVRFIESYNPDLVLFKFWHPFFAPAYNFIIKRVKKRCDCKVVMICDNIFPHEKFPLSRKIIKRIVRNVDGFVVQSSVVEDELKAIVSKPVYVKRFHPIYNSYPKLIDKVRAKEILKIKILTTKL